MKYSPAMAPGRMLKISMVSVNADPLAPVGCSAAGAQNLHVDELSAALVRAGHDVTVFTRRAHVGGPDRVRARAGYSVDYLEAGPTQRQDRVSLRRLGLKDVDQDLVADAELGAALVAVAGAAAVHELAVADDALALATEVDEDLVGVMVERDHRRARLAGPVPACTPPRPAAAARRPRPGRRGG